MAKSPTSDPTLSEVARWLVLPEGITSTGWPAVRDTCGKLGLGFDRWQAGAARGILAKNAEGLYAADTVAISIPRQVGKTYLLAAIIFALCLIEPGLLVLWTAHRFKTTRETFRSMAALAELPLVRAHVLKVTRGRGDEAIEFRNGSRILFGARERGFGRGMAGVGIIVFDEAQILSEDAVDDMIPATNTVENPLILYTGTPPKPKDPGEVFSALRREATAGETADVFYLELGADPDADPLDRAQWRKANPSFPRRTSERSILRMRRNLGAESFLREGLGIWDGTGKPPVFRHWPDRAVDGMPMPKKIVLGVAANADGSRASIAAAGRVAGTIHVGVVDRRQDTEWLVEKLLDVKGRRPDVTVAVRSKGALSDVLEDLEDAGLSLVELTESEWIDACMGFARLVDEGGLIHPNHTHLNRAVAAAVWRKVGSRRALIEQDADISMLEAAVLAAASTENDYDPIDSVL